MRNSDFRLLVEGWRTWLNEVNDVDDYSGHVSTVNSSVGINNVMRKIKYLEGLYENGWLKEKIRIEYSMDAEWGEGEVKYVDVILSDVGEKLTGEISFENTERDWPDGFALGGYRILQTYDVTKGFGPLLYEIIIEKATEEGKFLMSDRHEVSQSAKRVWDVYLNRPDVEKIQLDINDHESKELDIPQITPDFKDDDTSMDSAIKDKGEKYWPESSLAKGYYKKGKLTPVLDYLRNSDLIDFIEK